MSKMLVNFIQKVNNEDIREEELDGHKYVVLPSKTMPANVVMNRLMYPGEQIDKAIKSIDGSPAPIDHPKINGEYVNARDTRAALEFGAGINKLVGKDGDRYSVEKWVNKELLQNTARGKRLQSAIDTGSPIHTSTGVFLREVDNSAGENEYGKYDAEVEIVEFDHDAILPDSDGANTPERGTGIFVNSSGEDEELDVMFVNFSAGDDFSDSSNATKEKIGDALTKKLNPLDTKGVWICVEDFNQDTAIYWLESQLYSIRYAITDDIAELTSEPRKTEHKTVYKFNAQHDSVFNRYLARFASALGINVKSITDNRNGEALMSLLDAQLRDLEVNFDEKATEAEKLGLLINHVATNAAKSVEQSEQLTADAVAKIVTDTLATNKLEESKVAKSALVDQVIAANKNYTEDDKGMLLETPDKVLNSFLPTPKAAPLGAAFNHNGDEQPDHALDLNAMLKGDK